MFFIGCCPLKENQSIILKWKEFYKEQSLVLLVDTKPLKVSNALVSVYHEYFYYATLRWSCPDNPIKEVSPRRDVGRRAIVTWD